MTLNVRGTSGRRLGVGVHEDVIDDVDNAVPDEDVGANDSGLSAVTVAHEEASLIADEGEGLTASAVDGLRGWIRSGSDLLEVWRVEGRSVHILEQRGRSQKYAKMWADKRTWLRTASTTAVWLPCHCW